MDWKPVLAVVILTLIYFHFNLISIILAIGFTTLFLLVKPKKIKPPLFLAVIIFLCFLIFWNAGLFEKGLITAVDYPYKSIYFNVFSNTCFPASTCLNPRFIGGLINPSFMITGLYAFSIIDLISPLGFFLNFRFFVFLCFIFALVGIFLFSKKIFDYNTAILASLLWVFQTHDILIYGGYLPYLSLGLALISLYIYESDVLKKKNQKNFLFLSLAFLAITTYLFSFFLIIFYIIARYIEKRKRSDINLILCLVSASFLFVFLHAFSKYGLLVDLPEYGKVFSSEMEMNPYLFNSFVAFYQEFIMQTPHLFFLSIAGILIYWKRKRTLLWSLFLFILLFVFICLINSFLIGLPLFDFLRTNLYPAKIRTFFVPLLVILSSGFLVNLFKKKQYKKETLFITTFSIITLCFYLFSLNNMGSNTFYNFHSWNFSQIHPNNGKVFSEYILPKTEQIYDHINILDSGRYRFFLEGSIDSNFGDLFESTAFFKTNASYASVPYPSFYSNDGFFFSQNTDQINRTVFENNLDLLSVRYVIVWNNESINFMSDLDFVSLKETIQETFYVFEKKNATPIFENFDKHQIFSQGIVLKTGNLTGKAHFNCNIFSGEKFYCDDNNLIIVPPMTETTAYYSAPWEFLSFVFYLVSFPIFFFLSKKYI